MSERRDKIKSLLNSCSKIVDLSLRRMHFLLAELGDPHLKIPPVIHIAGTNGKGSAVAFLRAFLEASGKHVHVYTSPHLVNWNERYRIGGEGGGKFVSNEKLIEVLEHVIFANRNISATVFEVLTAVCFLLFSEFSADVTLLEVGLGGRLDATNVVNNTLASLIMPISLDHQSLLGNKIEDIAREKAGIIKLGIPVVIGYQENKNIYTILENYAKKFTTNISVYEREYNAHIKHGRMLFQNKNGSIDLPLSRLIGDFQINNSVAALEVIFAAGFTPDNHSIKRAMYEVCWPGRMQKLKRGKLLDLLPIGSDLWIDGGHNPAAGVVIAKTAFEICQKKGQILILVCGMLNTKDAENYLAAFKNIAHFLYTISLSSSVPGISGKELARFGHKHNIRTQNCKSLLSALLKIKRDTVNMGSRMILLGGSLHLVGEALDLNGTPPE